MPYRLLQKILSYTATPISKVLLFLMSITYSTFLFSQDSIPISLPVNIDSSTSTITVIDTIAHSNRNDSLKNDKKEARAEKTKKVFKYMSYFNYNDRGYGKDFSGIEKYLPYAGKKITCIDVVIFRPFGAEADGSYTATTKGQKFGNAIHFKSREWYIKGDIFFKEGDTINPALFADTEKLLWERRKFKEVKLLIIPDSLDQNNAEVVLFVQDRLSWSMSVGYYNQRVVMNMSTFNFFGLPHTLSVFTGINFNKHNLWAVGGTYKYENIQASQVNFITEFVVEKLNQKVAVSLNRSFFNLKTAFAFNAKYVFDNTTISLNGNIRDPSSYVRAKSNFYSLWLASAVAANKVMPCKDDKLKFIFATKLNYLDYKNRPFLINKNYNELFIKQQNYLFGFGIARWDYYLEKSAYYIDVAEYFPRGISASLWAGLQIDEVYGKRAAIDLSVNYGIYVKRFGYLYPQASYNGFVRNKKGEQMKANFQVDYVSKQVSFARYMKFRQIIKAGTTLGFYIPEERYFNINDMKGIRGFYSPTLKGSQSVTLSLESNFLLNKTVAMSKGLLYAFCDMGWLSENGEKLIVESDFQYGIGAGIRLRSVDLGFPYIDFQFGFYPKGKSFGAQLFQFKLYEQNNYAVLQNNMFVETPMNYNAKPSY